MDNLFDFRRGYDILYMSSGKWQESIEVFSRPITGNRLCIGGNFDTLLPDGKRLPLTFGGDS